MLSKQMIYGVGFTSVICAILFATDCNSDSFSTIALHNSRAYTPQHLQLYKFTRNNAIGFIDGTGKILVPPVLRNTGLVGFREGRLDVELADGVPAYVTEDGHIIKETDYEMVGWFSEGLAWFVQKVGGQRRHGFLDKNNDVRIPPKFIQTWEFHDGLAAAQNEQSKWGFIDIIGNWKIAPQFNLVGNFGNNLAPVDLCGRCAYINQSGQRAFPATFQRCWNFSDGVAQVKFDENSWGFIDTSGRTISMLYSRINNTDGISEGLVQAAKKDSGIGFVDVKGNWVIPPSFDWVQPFHEGLAAVFKDDKWGYIDHSGQFVITPRFCDNKGYTGNFQEGLAFVCDPKTKKFGFIDRTGRYAIAPRFITDEQGGCAQNRPCGFDGALAYVITETRFGYINKQGRFVYSEPTHQEADPPARRHVPGKKTVR